MRVSKKFEIRILKLMIKIYNSKNYPQREAPQEVQIKQPS
jgi:hypothetical protein